MIGDGAVGLSAVLAARRLGAERIVLMGRHKDRTDLGRELGATDVVAERGEDGIEKVHELTGGDGPHTVLECVGLKPAIETALAVALLTSGGLLLETLQHLRNTDLGIRSDKLLTFETPLFRYQDFDRRVAYVARSAKGAVGSPLFSARWRQTLPTILQTPFLSAR